jgi:hypothetical protein
VCIYIYLLPVLFYSTVYEIHVKISRANSVLVCVSAAALRDSGLNLNSLVKEMKYT